MSLLDRLFQLRDDTDLPKPFLQHLEELRLVLIKSGAVLVLSMVGALCFQKRLFHLMEGPLVSVDPKMVARLQNLGVVDPFMISLTLAFYAGLIISFPLLLYFALSFIVPALTRKEKTVVLPALVIGFGLFLGGVAFCYFCILPQTLKFFFEYSASLNITPAWAVRDYFSFVTQMLVAFGLAFELPVAVLAMVFIGLLSFEKLNRTRPYAYMLVLVLAAVIAPTPDPIAFLSLGIPMCLLYEGCIWLAWLMGRFRAKKAVLAEEAAENPDGNPTAELAETTESTDSLP